MQTVTEALNLLKRQTEIENAMKNPQCRGWTSGSVEAKTGGAVMATRNVSSSASGRLGNAIHARAHNAILAGFRRSLESRYTRVIDGFAAVLIGAAAVG
jgi:hypothetical protein